MDAKKHIRTGSIDVMIKTSLSARKQYKKKGKQLHPRNKREEEKMGKKIHQLWCYVSSKKKKKTEKVFTLQRATKRIWEVNSEERLKITVMEETVLQVDNKKLF